MSDIPTWHQRAMAHPDHQSGMISEGMIRARMCEEIEDLRAEIERLRADRRERIATAALQGILANSYKNSPSREIVVAASVYADLMIAKLNEEPQP